MPAFYFLIEHSRSSEDVGNGGGYWSDERSRPKPLIGFGGKGLLLNFLVCVYVPNLLRVRFGKLLGHSHRDLRINRTCHLYLASDRRSLSICKNLSQFQFISARRCLDWHSGQRIPGIVGIKQVQFVS